MSKDWPTQAPTAVPTLAPTCMRAGLLVTAEGLLVLIPCVVLAQLLIFCLLKYTLRVGSKSAVVPEAASCSLVEELKDAPKVGTRPPSLDIIRSKLRAASYTYCTGKRTKADILRFLNHQDSDRSGSIEYQEFSRMVRKRVKLSKAEMQLLCTYIDVDNDACIRLDEFVNFLKHPTTTGQIHS